MREMSSTENQLCPVAASVAAPAVAAVYKLGLRFQGLRSRVWGKSFRACAGSRRKERLPLCLFLHLSHGAPAAGLRVQRVGCMLHGLVQGLMASRVPFGCVRVAIQVSQARVSSAHIRQPGPDFSPDFPAKALQILENVTFSPSNGGVRNQL
jgi:hypothetical protein